MTAAPRVQVYTQLACNAAYGKPPHDHSNYRLPPHLSLPFVPVLEHTTFTSIPVHFPRFSHSPEHANSEDPRQLSSERCFSDPVVQAGAARLQTIMATIMGVLSVCTTAWWGHYGQKHGRTKVLAASTLGTLFTYTPLFVHIPSELSRFFIVISRSCWCQRPLHVTTTNTSSLHPP
jgi:hypothetical protein